MTDFPAVHKDWVSAWQRQREPTKLECALLGALSAAIVLSVFFWLGVQFSILKLLVQIT